MDIGPGTDADLLQRALDGEDVVEPGILELVAVLHAVTSIGQESLAPRVEFVNDLRTRLLDADLSSTVTPSPSAPPDASPSVVRISSRPIRQLLAAAAAVILLAGGLGVVSRQAVPGDLLYPVKQLLDRVAVQLAGSKADEGLTQLAQAQQHISEARELLDRDEPTPADLTQAFDSASDSTRAAQATLLEVYRVERRADALMALGDFFARALPQVDAMRQDVPADALPAWERLRAVLAQGQLDTLRAIATCTICGDRPLAAQRSLDVLLAGTPATPPGSSIPTAAGTGASGLPGATISLPGATLGSARVGLPSVGVTSTAIDGGGGGVTLPGATLNLPTLGVTSKVVVGGGGATLPGATLTGPTLSASLPTVPLP